MLIPDSCEKWIRLQRSGYKDWRADFWADMKLEYEMMKQYLPKECHCIVDIGCGVGGIDVFLSKHYGNPDLWLFDNQINSDKVVYGFDNGKSFYNSFEATRDLMKVNDILNCHLHDIRNREPAIYGKADLVVSLLSWGYHYPVSEYIDYVYAILSENGVVIMDVREKTDGIEQLRKVFSCVEIIKTFNKADRIIARR